MLITSSWCYLALAALAVLGAVVADGPKELMIQMKYPIDFDWPDEGTRETALADGSYKPINTIPTGIKVFKNMVYLCVPRWYDGIASTLNVVEGKKYEIGKQPKLTPWPDWSWQNASDCDRGIAFSMSVEIDPKGRVWVLDTGNNNLYERDTSLHKFFCPPSVLVFDAETKELLTRFHLPEEIASPETNFLNDIVVDPVNDWAYISDNDGKWREGRGGVIAVQPFNKTATRLQGLTTNPEKRAESYIMGGKRWNSNNPVNSIALHPSGDWVYYAPNTGYIVHMISTADMQDTSLTPQERDARSLVVGQKPTPSASLKFASNGTMFFSGLTMDAMLAWTWGGGLLDNTWWVAYQDHEDMQFLDQLDFDERGYDTPNPEGSNLWWITNQLFEFVFNKEAKDWTVNIFKAAVDTSDYGDAIMDGEMTVTYVPTSPASDGDGDGIALASDATSDASSLLFTNMSAFTLMLALITFQW